MLYVDARFVPYCSNCSLLSYLYKWSKFHFHESSPIQGSPIQSEFNTLKASWSILTVNKNLKVDPTHLRNTDTSHPKGFMGYQDISNHDIRSVWQADHRLPQEI